ncbi:D-xylose-proton symporter-like 3, chloroplastic [Porphyridium purpureum]|uniref:D-xylose-proton symporter-like 3, chloroplastic n=1 Tax=Porphyridium purpureum TaxID=35688 RepID=A0A5J4YP36_PORPP|nr:D-xylose-proton symporter-like 3, chloroplastic [Porphyridium purpureum]|eukprot:POR1746..scf295_9
MNRDGADQPDDDTRRLLERMPASSDQDPIPVRVWAMRFAVPAAVGSLFGLDIGLSSGAVRALGDAGLGAAQLGAVASASLFGALVSSALALRFGDSLGRARELRLAALLFVVGAALQAVAPLDISTESASLAGSGPLLAARAVYGLGIGFGMHAAPLYIAESTPKQLRGLLLSAKEAAIVTGILLGYISSAVFGPNLPVDVSWRAMFASAEAIAVPVLVLSAFLPESPRWLCLKSVQTGNSSSSGGGGGGGGEDENPTNNTFAVRAREGFIQLYDGNVAEADKNMQLVMDTLRDAEQPKVPGQGSFSLGDLVATKSARTSLVIGLGLVLFQQITGQPSVLYYANRIFAEAGGGFEFAVGVGVFKLVMTLGSAFAVDRVGRRTLLMTGTTGMAVCLLVLSAAFHGTPSSGALSTSQQIVIALGVLGYVGSYQIGFGPCTWLVLSEIFPIRIRSSALGLGTLTNFGSNLVVASVFEAQRQALGSSGLFGLFAVIALLAVAFEYSFVIETKGLSLEEIERKIT